MNELLIVAVALLLLLCSVSIFYAVKFGLVILRLEDVIEAALDDLDERYKNLANIASKPVFFDSIEVRQCIQEIQNSRDVIQLIALNLTSINNTIDKEEVKIDQDSKKSNEEKNDTEEEEGLELKKKTIFWPGN